MDESMEKLIDEKMVVVLNLIRTNNKADEALKLTQSFVNMGNGKNILQQLQSIGKSKRQGAGA